MGGKAPVVLRLDFTGMAFGGEAIARHEGKAIFVPFAMPGDSAEVELVEDRERFARGRIRRLVSPAPARSVPRCKHFGMCGGCHWQHIPYPLQLDYKTQIVREQLARIGGIQDACVLPALGAEDPWHYRNNVQFHLTRDGRLGFMAARTNSVVPIEECHIMAPPVEALWRELELDLPDLSEVTLRAGIHNGAHNAPGVVHRHADDLRPSAGAQQDSTLSGSPATAPEPSGRHADDLRPSVVEDHERLVALRLDSDEAPEAEIDLAVNCVVQLSDGSEVVLAGDDYFHETLAGHSFQVSADSFFQVNTPQAEKLVALVVEAVRAALAPGAGGAPSEAPADGAILDAYCGVGTFAVPLAEFARPVIAIEGAPGAVRDARVNARAFPNIEILAGSVETVLPALSVPLAVAVLDPPREGCAPAVLDALSSRRVPRIVYVSCDPSTLARDVKRLAAAGYALDSAQPIDLFPQTFHIETVARLSLRARPV